MQPFLDNHVNPSFLIASSLPAYHLSSDQYKINIHLHPDPIDVRYAIVRELIPKLVFHNSSTHVISDFNNVPQTNDSPENSCSTRSATTDEPRFDIILHLGMAAGRDFYNLETLAHRDGYEKSDIDGQSLSDDTFWRDKYNAPPTLSPTFDVEDVLRRWKSATLTEDVRASDDAGHYLCDFTFYASMLEYWRRDPEGKRPCMFLHVPGHSDSADVERGREVALGLISALVKSEIAKWRTRGEMKAKL